MFRKERLEPIPYLVIAMCVSKKQTLSQMWMSNGHDKLKLYINLIHSWLGLFLQFAR